MRTFLTFKADRTNFKQRKPLIQKTCTFRNKPNSPLHLGLIQNPKELQQSHQKKDCSQSHQIRKHFTRTANKINLQGQSLQNPPDPLQGLLKINHMKILQQFIHFNLK